MPEGFFEFGEFSYDGRVAVVCAHVSWQGEHPFRLPSETMLGIVIPRHWTLPGLGGGRCIG